jgi:hypothetical protein
MTQDDLEPISHREFWRGQAICFAVAGGLLLCIGIAGADVSLVRSGVCFATAAVLSHWRAGE